MNKLVARFLLVVIVISGGVLGMIQLEKMKTPPAKKVVKEIPLVVEGVRAVYDEFTITVDGYGTVRSAKRVLISPEVGGKVVYARSPLEAGDIVEMDEVLFRIDPRMYNLAVKSAKADLVGLQAKRERIEQQILNDRSRLEILTRSKDLAKSRFERLQILFEEKQVGSLTEVEAAESNLSSQENQLTILKNSLALYPRQLMEVAAAIDNSVVRREQASLDLEKTEISAPFRGRLAMVNIEEGQLLSPGQAVLTLVDDSCLEIPLSLDSRDVRIWLLAETHPNGDSRRDGWYSDVAGIGVTIRWTGASDTFVWPGIIARVEKFNPDTRTIIAIAQPVFEESADKPLFPLAEGMFCTVDIPARKPVTCIKAPRTSVTHERLVFISKDSRLKSIPVKMIHQDADSAYFSGDIEDNDIIITTRLVSPLEGRLISPILPEQNQEDAAK